MAATWDEVTASPEWNALPVEQKTEVRNAFFDREIAPKAPKEHIDQVREAWNKRTAGSLARTEMVGGFPSRPENIQDSGAFWKEQVIKGVSQVPELSATGADVLLNSPFGRLLEYVKSAVTGKAPEKSDIAGKFRQSERDLGIIKDIPPQTTAQRAFGKPVEFAAASLPFSAANVAAAPGRKLTAAAIEALSTGLGAEGAALGEAVGREATGGTGGAVTGALLGGAAGGGMSAMAIPKVAERGLEGAKEGLKRFFQFGTGGRKLTEQQLEDILGPRMAQILKADPGAAERLAESAKVSARVPDFKPDLASATGSKVVTAMKERVSREGPDVLARFDALAERNRQALSQFTESSFPKVGERPQDLARKRVESNVSDLEANYKIVKDRLDKQIAETDKLIGDLTAAHERAPSNTLIGERLQQLQEDARKLRYAEAQSAYLPVYELADQMGFKADIGPLVEDIRKAMRDPVNPIKRDQFPSVWNAILEFAKRKDVDVAKKAMNLAYKGKMPDSMTQFIARNGGLSKASLSGEFKDMERLPKGLHKATMSNLVRTAPNAKTADEMRMALIEAGYMQEGDDINKMYRMIQEEFGAGEPLHFAMRDHDAAMRILSQRQAEIGQEVFELQQEARKGSVPVSFKEFHDLIKRVNRDLEQPGRATQNLQDLKTKLNSQLSEYGAAGDIGSELAKANEFWAQQFSEPFKRGAGAVMRATSKKEDIVERAFLRRGERGAEDWKRIYGDNPEAAKLLYQGVADSFVSQAVGQGDSLNLSKAKTWLNKNDAFLKNFPELRQEFDDVIRNVERIGAEGEAKASALQEKLKAIDQAKKEVEKGALAKVAGIEDTRKVAQGAIASPSEMDAVLRLVRGKPDAMQGFATELAQAVLAHSNPEAYMVTHADSLKKAFNALGPNHWDNLQAIVKGEQIMARGQVPDKLREAGIGGDPMQEILGTGSSQLFSLAKGLGSWVSPEYAVFHVGGRYLFKVRREQQQAFLVEMMTNPEIASRLAKAYKDITPETADQIARGLYTQGTQEAKEAFRQAVEEIQPMLRLHGLRVTVNAANIPGREEFRQQEEKKSKGITEEGIRGAVQRRINSLQGGVPR